MIRQRRWVAWLATAIFLVSPVAPVDALETLRPGARGKVRTALTGNEVESIPVVFLGTYENILGPGHDLLLVRLEGPRVENVGVAAGMSGSPVYFDGNLVGALSYRMGSLPLEAVAGVTPIDDLLDAGRSPRAAAGRSNAAGPATVTPIATPVQAAGMHPLLRERLAPEFERNGFVLVDGGGTLDRGTAEVRLEPGSPVGVELVRGDQVLAATGTITTIDGDRVYAFGHPFLGTGRVELPMVTAEVIHTLADLAGSVKLANTGPEFGAVVQDRLAGIVGHRGRKARMVPVEITIEEGESGRRRFGFEVARDRRLTPLLVGLVASNALMNTNDYDSERTIVARGTIRPSGLEPLPVEYAYAGGPGPDPSVELAAQLNRTIGALWFSPLAEVDLDGVELNLRVEQSIRRYRVEELHYDRGELRPGADLEIRCELQSYRGDAASRTFRLRVPRGIGRDRRLMLAVGAPDQIEKALGKPIERRLSSARSLPAVVAALGELRAANRLTAVLFERSRGVVSGGVAFDSLPPTAERLLAAGTANGGASRSIVALRDRVDLELDGPVEGGLMVRLRVKGDLAESQGERP